MNGYNNYTKTYCYVSRRYRIIKGSPKGCPTFNFIESGKTLSDVQLSGTMKNKIGKTVTGTFTWENGTQTVQAGTAYKWTFTPDDNDHYEVVNGESIVCPIHQVIFDTNGGSKVNETNAEYNKEKETQKPATDTDKKPTGTDTDKKPANADKLTASDNPETGDTANITAWLALMIVSLGLLAGSFAVRKSRKS